MIMAMIAFACGQETGFSAKAVATHHASVLCHMFGA